MSGLFTLAPNRWYGWQMIPGYAGSRCVPYFSPVYMRKVTPKKSGKGIIQMEFLNVLYAEGVQWFEVNVRVTNRSANFLIGELIESQKSADARCVVLSHIEFEWLRRFCPEIMGNSPVERCSSVAQSSVSMYLNEVFGFVNSSSLELPNIESPAS